MSFKQLKQDSPCPICNSHDGRCREIGDLILCMTFPDGGSINGWHFLGSSKDGLWGKWEPERDRTYTGQERREWRDRQQRREQERERVQQERAARSMPVAERDQWYRRLLSELTLDPTDRDDLRQRGLTDAQINARGYRSVAPGQRLSGRYPANLPGVIDGRLMSSGKGYLCPVTDHHGQIQAFQIRLQDGTAGRYRWLSTKQASPHTPCGELPLSVVPGKLHHQGVVNLVEGTGAKPHIVALRTGLPTIGAAGGQWASSPTELRAALVGLGAQTVTLYPDAGAIGNPNVMRQYRRVAELLQQWGYALDVAWWNQLTKESPDPDELTETANLVRITWSEFEAISHQQHPASWMDKYKRALSNYLARHTPKRKAQEGASSPAPSPATFIEYDLGERIATWRSLIAQRNRVLLDNSWMGLGKSFDSGKCQPADFGANQIIYVANNHRNPTTTTLDEGWVDLESRHGGLTIENTPDGGQRLRRTKKGETPHITSNCSRHRIAGVLREKGVQGADTATLICGTCPLREACTHSEGNGYGYLYQRRLALASPRLRAHPDSLPSPTDYDYSETVLSWEEPGESLRCKQTLTVSLEDLHQTLGALLPHTSLNADLQGLLTALLGYLDESIPTGRYGLPHNEIVEQLPDCSGLDVDAITAAIQPDLSFLNTTEQYGVDLQDLPPALRKKFAERDIEISDKARERLIKQWLPMFLKVLQGTTRGNLHAHRGKLFITIPDPRHQAVLQACKGVILLDGTLDPADLALMMGIPAEKITVARQKVETPDNLTVIQVADIGRLGMQRGADDQRQVAAIIDHFKQDDPTTEVIDFLKFQDDGKGAWWRDSRGSNAYISCKTLVLVGTPCRNLTDLKADFAILTGSHDFDSEEFGQFRDRRIRADIHQGIYRLRPHLRPDEQLRVIVLSDFDLGLPNVVQMAARDITPAAASKFERFQIAVAAAIAQLREAGAKVTQAAVSAICGYSQQYLSRHWALLQTLLETSYSKSGKNSGAPPDLETEPIIEALASVVNEVATLQDPKILIETLEVEVFPNLPDYLIGAFLARLQDSTWQPLLTALLPLVGWDELEGLAS